ncbi:MAG: TonB-dependent siderophore receptor [Acidobacteriota bacterium]
MHEAAVRIQPFCSVSLQGSVANVWLLIFCMVLGAGSYAQDTPPKAAVQASESNESTSAPGQSQHKLPPVTTTVVVHSGAVQTYLPQSVSVGTLAGEALKNAPLSATVITRQLLDDQVSRLLSDVVKNDASIGEDYAPVGYYGDFEIRGFPIDLATGLEINGMTIAGEQDVPLENKESVEFLNGIAGVESGVASAGGLVDFITKRPVVVKALDLATDHRGTAYANLELGRFFGAGNRVGALLNLGGEKIQSYVNGADGWRAVGTGSADWKLSSRAIWKSDFEYQHKLEGSVDGFQLLGGTVVPDLHRIFPSTMLGEQSWGKPNTFDTFNAESRLDYELPHAWRAFVAGSFSHSLIDDNVVWAYGCYYEPECNVPGGPPPFFFAPDGTYDIYDYRDPGELRIDAEAEAMIAGEVTTGPLKHDLIGGGELFLRSVQQPGFYTVANPYSPNGVVQAGAVYTYVGSENIYKPNVAFPFESPHQSAGPRRLWEDDHQSALLMQDRIHVPGRIQLLAAGRLDWLRDHNYSAYASCTDFSVPGVCVLQPTDKPVWLPQYAITFNPVESLTLYGNYGVMMSLGPQGPFWVDNGSQFLAPFFTRQTEIGAKYEASQRILLTADVFRMRAPFFYPKALQGPDSFCPNGSAGDLCFESEGHETHDGIELGAQGKAASWLQLSASVAAISAISTDTGTPAFNNKQVINVPRVRTTLSGDLALPHMGGLHLTPGWSYTARKAATRDDVVSVPGYNLFGLGARYTPGGENGHVTFRLYADNISDVRYWKDTGASYGDTFVHLGAPTTVRLAAHYTF